jgi:hypothetical protein
MLPPREEVMMMTTLACYLDEAVFGEVCPLNGFVMPFVRFFIN